MSTLIQLTERQQRMIRLERKRKQAVTILAAALNEFYREANREGEQQNFLDDLGTTAVARLTDYASARVFVLSQDPSASVPAPNLDVFVPNEDGTVTYVAPEVEVIPPPEQP